MAGLERRDEMEEVKKELQKHALVLKLILEVLESWSETEGVSLISSQQLHSPSSERNEKVRVLIQEIRCLDYYGMTWDKHERLHGKEGKEDGDNDAG